MQNIAVFDTSVRTLNLGDNIIMDSVYRSLNEMFKESFFLNISSHYHIDMRTMRSTSRFADVFFVGGTNLLTSNMLTNRLWKVGPIDSFFIRNKAVLLGTGWSRYSDSPNGYTKFLLRRLLSNQFIHSVRDSYTEKKLRECGFINVVNTGCPTTWLLTPEHCQGIPIKKAKSVVTTITDYCPDFDKDKMMIDILLHNYEKVALWIQGTGDYNYFKKLVTDNRITLIPPKLEEYDNFLRTNDVDFVGTRLHAGIRAMQFKKRALIIGVDNRAKEIAKDINLNVLNREEMRKIESIINNEIHTRIDLPTENIRKWKEQFS